MKTTSRKLIAVNWVLRLALAGLFAMAAVPKLTGDPTAAAMIDKLGIGSWAGPAIALTEIAAAVLLIVPATVAWGGLLGIATLAGAVLAHLTVLGISLGPEDQGSMFMMAIAGLVIAVVVTALNRDALPKRIGVN